MSAPRRRLQELLATTERQLLHLTRMLSTIEGTEATLCTLYYALTLVHSQCQHLLERSYERMAEDIVAEASKTMMPGETVAAHIVPPHIRLRDTCESVRSATDTVYRIRCFLRLGGLLRIYQRARQVYRKPPHDAIIKLLVWAQIAAKATYQTLENGAFLTSVGVFRSKKWLEREQKWWAWSNRAWLVFVGLEALRLLRVRQLRYNEEFGAESKAQDISAQSEELRQRWHRQFYATAGWIAPSYRLSFYDAWDSPVSEAWMGISGMVPGVMALQDAWNRTA